MGRYTGTPAVSGTIPVVDVGVSGAPGRLGDTYEVTFKKGEFELTNLYGPQGRNFDVEIALEGAVRLDFEKIKIDLGSLRIGEDRLTSNRGHFRGAGQTLWGLETV